MEYRTLGQTDIQLSVVTFGAWAIGGWMWGGTDVKQAEEAIHAAYHEGITSFDTAPVYGQGLSEEILGKALKAYPRDRVQILTKYGMRWDVEKGEFAFLSKDNAGKEIKIYKYAGKESVMKECEDSLHRLQTDYIDLYQIHWPDSTTPVEETMEAVQRLIEQGKVRAAGVCNYSVELMQRADAVIQLASNQVPYSMVRRDIEQDIVPYCQAHHHSILAYSPLQRGLLTGKYQPDHSFKEGDTRPDTPYFKPENIRRINAFLERIRPIAQDKGVTLSQLVVRWTVQQPGITVALVGARNAQQAKENARAGEFTLSSEELQKIDQELSQLVLA
ncbi:MAG: aldo/keto reductase [Thermoflavifilum sp.]|nr:aldo/keto reductase [Thermoflavifilum sp.]